MTRKRLLANNCLRCCKQFPSKFTFILHLRRKHLKRNKLSILCKDENLLEGSKWELQQVKTEEIYLPNVLIKTEYNEESSLSNLTSEQNPISATCKEEVEETQVEKLHPDTKVICKYCDKMYLKKYLEHHVFSIHCNAKRECKMCNKKFKKKDHLKTHWRKEHANMSELTCDFCGEQFTKRNSLWKHITKTHTVKALCATCNREFKSEYLLSLHNKRVHSQDSKLTCNICNKHFCTKRILKSHIKITHTVQPKITCESCNKEFKSKYRLLEHNKFAYSNSSKWTCAICIKLFCNKTTLRRHVLKIHADSPRLGNLIRKLKQTCRYTLNTRAVKEKLSPSTFYMYKNETNFEYHNKSMYVETDENLILQTHQFIIEKEEITKFASEKTNAT